MGIDEVQYQVGKFVGFGQHLEERAVQHLLLIIRKGVVVLLQKYHQRLLHRRRTYGQHQATKYVVLRAFRLLAEVFAVQRQYLALQKSAVVHTH